jgi:hypothetical protein
MDREERRKAHRELVASVTRVVKPRRKRRLAEPDVQL